MTPLLLLAISAIPSLMCFACRWYEDLQCPEVDQVLEQRLGSGEEPTLAYGKLLERLLTMKMIQENIPARGSRYGGTNAPRNRSEEEFTKAHFIKRLVPMAQQRLAHIK
jgi:hypothetical protein